MKSIIIHQEKQYKKLGDLYGLFFEDINHAADGGLYAELIQNRSFEFCALDRPEYHALTAWEKSEQMQWEVKTEAPLNEENIHYLEIKTKKQTAIWNLGFSTGIVIEKGKRYDFSMWARVNSGDGLLTISIKDKEQVAASTKLLLTKDTWTKYEAVLVAEQSTLHGKLYLEFQSEGCYDLDMISLFPQDTYKGRKGGLRKDIAEALEQMHPKFMRFPGGCLTHDGSLDDHARNSMYRWKRTIGEVEKRPSWRNNWGYNQTLGLGYFEYFVFCEDIGAKPLPVVPGGFNPHKGEGAAIEDIGAWVQETLDLIEFANGDVTTPMGAIRAKMGHPKPFHLEYLGVGNEEIGEGFFERYPYFHRAIKETYPEIKIINTAGPFAVGEGYEAGWSSAKKYRSDLVDEHYYSSPEWFLANMHHYEDFDPTGPKVFLGEYASWGNTYYNALVEAAYMTHLERAKAVALACYAPMLCHADYVNWKPDMLWFNNQTILKTANYYVQKMFMENQGTDAVSFETTDLEEVIPFFDKQTLSGAFTIAGNDIEGSIWDMTITDLETGAVKKIEPCKIDQSNTEMTFAEIDSSHYQIEFSFQRSLGRKGLKIFVGKTENTSIQWEFGGWDNWDCNIVSLVNGRSSAISHRIFHVEDIEYRLKIEVTGRRIQTWVNGVQWNDTVDRLPELEELYITASVDHETEKTYLKVVNLTGEEKETCIVLTGPMKNYANITTLKADNLSAENTFENPTCIVPTEKAIRIENNCLIYSFPAHSVTVFALES